jgi:hypothetical protein
MANNYLVFSHFVEIKTEAAKAAQAIIKLIEDVTSSFSLEGDSLFESITGENREQDLANLKDGLLKMTAANEPWTETVYGLINDDEFQGWLLSFLDSDRNTGAGLDFELDIHTDPELSPVGVDLYCEESGNMENAAMVTHFLIKAGVTVKAHELIEFCWYCDRLRVGEFGGSAVLVTSEYVRFRPGADEWALYELKGY